MQGKGAVQDVAVDRRMTQKLFEADELDFDADRRSEWETDHASYTEKYSATVEPLTGRCRAIGEAILTLCDVDLWRLECAGSLADWLPYGPATNRKLCQHLYGQADPTTNALRPMPSPIGILCVDTMEIDEEYRGSGVGTTFIQWLETRFGQRVRAVVVEPIPFTVEQRKPFVSMTETERNAQPTVLAARARLRTFYERQGFRQVPGGNLMCKFTKKT